MLRDITHKIYYSMQLDGKIIAPTNSGAWGSGLSQWLEFSKLKGISVKGEGVIDGRGSVWWNDSPNYHPTYDSVRGFNMTTSNVHLLKLVMHAFILQKTVSCR